ncbi:radical SAM protein [Kitasatospora sp. NBC_01266]|uniref:radical SAM protein n=1 Tax=Kitasatospora sp. NBC_01266 TaxID=2903572 RepID=UPI002E31A730|nr:radical SAM protein [Kitasatospora sp. NBC_01266]
MELAELVGLRPVPCAGLLVMLTQRCPLACAHCSTSSTPRGTDQDAADLLRFINSCGPTDRPELVLLTGGEPLLIPELVRELATSARAVGTRSALLSGMFFAREGRIPERVLRAITAVDHFSASIDAFHEREVARADVLRALATVLDAGIPVSLHVTGTGPDDPYLADLTGEVRRTFGDTVPMLVNEVRAVGRAAAWADPARVTATATPGAAMESAGGPLPCAMAAWPVVAADGTVLACCNQETVDRRPAPAHLRLGHIAVDDWPTVRQRALRSPALRMLRAVGPTHLYARFGEPQDGAERCAGYCDGCRALGEHPEVLAGATLAGTGPVGELLDLQAARTQSSAGPAALVRRFGCAPYADLVELSPTRLTARQLPSAEAPAGRAGNR